MYGWFTILMCSGSCLGVANWASFMMSRKFFFEGIDLEIQLQSSNLSLPVAEDLNSKFSDATRWWCASSMLVPLEFTFVCVAKLLVLFRMLEFADLSPTPSRSLLIAQRCIISVVAGGNIIGLVGNAISSYQFLEIPHILALGLANYSSNPKNVDGYADSVQKSFLMFKQASFGLWYQEASEAVILVVIVVMFAAAGVMCARRLNQFLSGSGGEGEAVSSARRLRLQIVATAAVVFVTFLLRMAFALFTTFIHLRQEIKDCKYNFLEICTNPCFNQ